MIKSFDFLIFFEKINFSNRSRFVILSTYLIISTYYSIASSFYLSTSLFDDKSIIVDCILDLKNEYKIKAMTDSECIDYSFIDTDIAHKVCELLKIEFLQLNKLREVKSYDERRNKNIIHVIYSFMTIQVHTKSCTSMMIIKLDQHSIILNKL